MTIESDNRPTISVVLATYNSSRYLRQQLESILDQTMPPDELVVCDDRSTDNTLEILKEYADRIKLNLNVNPESLGPVRNFAKGISLASSDLIALSDHDDVWLPHKLETSVNKLLELEAGEQADTPVMVFTDLKLVDEGLSLIAESFRAYSGAKPHKNSLARLLLRNTVTGCTILMNRALAELALPVGEHALMHDHWLALVAAAFGKMAFIEEATVLYRQHGGNVLGAHRAGRVSLSITRKWRFIKRYFIEGNFEDYLTKSHLLEQAEDFLKCFEYRLPEPQKQTVKNFIGLKELTGWKAVRTMLKNDFLLPNKAETIEFLIYGMMKK